MHNKFILLGFIPSKDLIISSNDNMASTQFDGNQFILRHCLTDVVMVHIQGRNYCQRLQKAAKKELYLLLFWTTIKKYCDDHLMQNRK